MPTKKTNENTEKVVTKYDLKKQRREAERKREIRNKKITIGVVIAIAAAIVIGAVIGVSTHFYTVYKKYIVVGGEDVSGIEFDYYYGKYKNATLSQTLYGTMTYGDYFKSYLGYDSSKSDSSQAYSSSSDYTWYDYFANGAANLIKSEKALINAAGENGFDYTTEEDDYNSFKESLDAAAESAGVSVSKYYEEIFGSNASESKIEAYVKSSLKAEAYSTKVQTDNEASDAEVLDYYNSNKQTYDTVDYRTFTISADDSDMDRAKALSDACVLLATSEQAFISESVDYVTDSTSDDPTLVSKTYYSSVSNSDVATWLYDETRQAGDVTAIADTSANTYEVIYFISRDFDTTLLTSTIKNTVTQQKYQTFISSYEDAVTIENTKNRIKMLGN